MTIEFTEVWQEVSVPFDTCRACQHGGYTTDPFGTGDSPAEIECNAYRETQCPYMEQFEIDVTKLQNIIVADALKTDAPDYADAFIDSADYLGEPVSIEKLEWINVNHPEIAQELAYEFAS